MNLFPSALSLMDLFPSFLSPYSLRASPHISSSESDDSPDSDSEDDLSDFSYKVHISHDTPLTNVIDDITHPTFPPKINSFVSQGLPPLYSRCWSDNMILVNETYLHSTGAVFVDSFNPSFRDDILLGLKEIRIGNTNHIAIVDLVAQAATNSQPAAFTLECLIFDLSHYRYFELSTSTSFMRGTSRTNFHRRHVIFCFSPPHINRLIVDILVLSPLYTKENLDPLLPRELSIFEYREVFILAV